MSANRIDCHHHFVTDFFAKGEPPPRLPLLTLTVEQPSKTQAAVQMAGTCPRGRWREKTDSGTAMASKPRCFL
jgi:hypothetical protein